MVNFFIKLFQAEIKTYWITCKRAFVKLNCLKNDIILDHNKLSPKNRAAREN
jgi:hypothetical protein